jgi:hypothetical protein
VNNLDLHDTLLMRPKALGAKEQHKRRVQKMISREQADGLAEHLRNWGIGDARIGREEAKDLITAIANDSELEEEISRLVREVRNRGRKTAS